VVSGARVLVAGIGNVFLGDDGFGVAVAQELLRRDDLGVGVTLREYGIRGFDLAYEMLSGYDAVVLVDAMPQGEPAGTISILEADVDAAGQPSPLADAAGAVQGHAMTPDAVIALVRAMGGRPPRTLVVGCQPESFGDVAVGRMGLSDSVGAAIPAAVKVVRGLVRELCSAGGASRAVHA
jgi:hydrogenase maturation protease